MWKSNSWPTTEHDSGKSPIKMSQWMAKINRLILQTRKVERLRQHEQNFSLSIHWILLFSEPVEFIHKLSFFKLLLVVNLLSSISHQLKEKTHKKWIIQQGETEKLDWFKNWYKVSINSLAGLTFLSHYAVKQKEWWTIFEVLIFISHLGNSITLIYLNS